MRGWTSNEADGEAADAVAPSAVEKTNTEMVVFFMAKLGLENFG